MKKIKGQIKISFGMIFSIILIIIFISFAFYAIKTFLKTSSSAQTGKFINDLQNDIDNVWKSTESSSVKTYFLPKKITYVCFVDFSKQGKGKMLSIYNDLKRYGSTSQNILFYPPNSTEMNSLRLENINLLKITQTDNPFCIKNQDGEIRLILKKDFDESLVTVEKV